MVFNSLQFIFVFFPLVVLGLALLSRRGGSAAAPVFLLIASLVFYAFSGVRGLAGLLLSIAFNYLAARAIGGGAFGHRRLWLWLGVAGNLLLLVAFKYTRALTANALELAQAGPEATGWVVPLGVSFYTLSQIGYLLDAYSAGSVERSPIRYALFVAGFPFVSAGPILRYKDLHSQFSSPLLGVITARRLAAGLTLMAIGLFNKAVLAAAMAGFADPVFDAAARNTPLAWWEGTVGAVAYSFQLYFDFSGYSDIAVGLGWMCGLALPWNFNSPYKAVSIVDFWDRWHVSLSRWLQAFLFTPLVLTLSRLAGASRMQGVSMLTWAYAAATFITMLLCGIWHGVGWTFAVWGLMHGAFLVVHRASRDLRHTPPIAPVWVRRGMTFAAVTMAWVVFRAPTLDAAAQLWWAIGGGTAGLAARGVLGAFSPSHIAGWMVAAGIIVWGLPSTREWMDTAVSGWRPNVRVALAVSALFVYAILSLQGKSAFIYLGF